MAVNLVDVMGEGAAGIASANWQRHMIAETKENRNNIVGAQEVQNSLHFSLLDDVINK